MTACVTFSPRYASAASFSLRRIMAETLGRRVLLAADLDARVVVAGLHDLVRDELDLLQNLVVAAAHEPLDREHGVLGVRDALPLRHLPHEDLVVLREADDGGRETAALLVRDHRRIAALDHRDHGVRRPEVDADHFCHDPVLLSSSWIGGSRGCAAPACRRLQQVDLDLARLHLFRLRQLHRRGRRRDSSPSPCRSAPSSAAGRCARTSRTGAPRGGRCCPGPRFTLEAALALDRQEVARDRDLDVLLG